MDFLFDLLRQRAFSRGAVRWSGGAIACAAFYLLIFPIGGHGAEPPVALIIAVEVALIAAVATGIGRHFAVGFISAIVAFGIASRGLMIVIPWGMPVMVVSDALHKSSDSRARSLAHTLSRDEWLQARRGAAPALAQGQILANAVTKCADWYRGNDTLDSNPRRGDEGMFVGCGVIA